MVNDLWQKYTKNDLKADLEEGLPHTLRTSTHTLAILSPQQLHKVAVAAQHRPTAIKVHLIAAGSSSWSAHVEGIVNSFNTFMVRNSIAFLGSFAVI